MIELSVNK